MKPSGPLRIAGRRTDADWRALRAQLDSSAGAEFWRKAYRDFFLERLETRYFKPIEVLDAIAKEDGEGFAIVTLHCALIEFLAATVEGKSYRYVKNGDPPLGPFEYSKSGEMFTRFLTTHVPFRDIFTDGHTAQDFYAGVRCGLLHEARTKNGWRILAGREASGPAIDTAAQVIYRSRMRHLFDEFTAWHGARLETDRDLQAAFLRKLDSLCEA